MKKNRPAIVALVAAIAVLTLSGCANYTKDQALETPNAVIELTQGDLFTSPTYGYVNQVGNVVPLTECTDATLFDQRYCEDADGIYRFTWSKYKGSITRASYTVDGVKHDLDCNRDADNSWDGYKVCLPKGTPVAE